MSGPKVINLEAVRRRRQRESLVQIRKLRDTIGEWRDALQQTGGLDQTLDATAQSILARAEELRQTEQWDTLRNELSAHQVFFKDAADNARQAGLQRLASRRERRRRLDLGMAMLQRELLSAGLPSPPGFESAADADETDLSRLERLLENALRQLPGQPAPDAAAAGRQQALADALKEQPSGPSSFTDWLASHSGENATLQAKNDRLSRALAELELQAPKSIAAPLFERARLIAHESAADRRALLTDSLLLEADELCRSLREQQQARSKLQNTLAGLEPFQSAEAEAWRQRLNAAMDNPSPRAVVELASAAEQWIVSEAAREEAELRREAVLKALATLGYEVRQGMATAWAEDGRVVVRKASEPNYGVELASPPMATAVQARVVAFDGPQRSAASAQRDQEVEASWCQNFQEVRKLLEAEGVVPTLVSAKAAGEVPLKVIPSEGTEHPDARSLPATPRARQVE